MGKLSAGKAAMKIGVLSDAHGNPDGLKMCIDFFIQKKVGKIYFLGDAIGYLSR